MIDAQIIQAISEVATSIVFIAMYLRERARSKELSDARVKDLKEMTDERVKDYAKWTDTLSAILTARGMIQNPPQYPSQNSIN